MSKVKPVIEKEGKAYGQVTVQSAPHTLEAMIELFDVDMDVWEVEKHYVNSWDVTNGAGERFTNYQIKVWFKRIKEALSLKVMKEELKAMAKNHSFKYKPINYKVKKTENCLEIDIMDLHLGKLAWVGETGDNYDFKIASKRFMESIKDLLSKGLLFGFDKILLVAGNDFFHIDNPAKETTKGTPQDSDLRWKKLYRVGVELLRDGIDLLSQYAPVDVVVIPGNHDKLMMFTAGVSLECVYENNPNVNIDNGATDRKCYVYGKNFIGLSHERIKDISHHFSVEFSKEWGNTIFREIHLGHKHSSKVERFVGVDEEKSTVIRQLRSLSGTDAWHYSKGYMSIKGACAFVWAKNNGIVAQLENNLFLKSEK